MLKEKRKHSDRTLRRRIITILVVIAFALVSLGGIFAILKALGLIGSPPPSLNIQDPIYIDPELFASYETMQLDINPQKAKLPPERYPAILLIPNDLAWDKPSYASSYYANGYPERATNGLDGQSGSDSWRTAGSDGSWFYVDLGTEQSFHVIMSQLFVDAAFTSAPETYYIASNDLKTWQIVVKDINTRNSSHRWTMRQFVLPETVAARYVGVYAKNWGGGWGGLDIFAVLP